MAVNYVKFQRGSQTAYDALKTTGKLDNDTLYFIYPEGNSAVGALYMGARVISGGDITIASATLDDLADVIVNGAGANSFLMKEGDKWVAKELSDVVALIKQNLGDIASTAQVFQGTVGADEEASAAITRVIGDKAVHAGDNVILKKLIAGNKYEYTAYVYDGSAWAAMDGNYDADNVYFGNDLVLTANVGAQVIPSSGSKILDTTGKTVRQVFDMLFSARKLPEKVEPEITLVSGESKSYEVGTSIIPSYTASLSAGSYAYGPATGVSASSWSVALGDQILATSEGTFNAMTVKDDTDLAIKATATYEDGAVPVDNFGESLTDPVELSSCQIAAGSVSVSGAAIKGFRSVFYGAKIAPIDLVSNTIRGLNKINSDTSSLAITIPDGAKQVVIAVPAGKVVKAVNDANALGVNIVKAFNKTVVSVGGADATLEDIGSYAKDYNVYVYTPAVALSANTYNITLVNE